VGKSGLNERLHWGDETQFCPLPIYLSRPPSPDTVKSMKIGEKNVGMIDRVVRIIIGIVLIAAFSLGWVGAPWSYLVALIGLIVLVTGVVGTCALYSLLGMNTLGKQA
jgi:Protein of unknown function (DUF2892)